MRYISKNPISIVTMSILICLIHIAALPMVEELASAQQQTVTNPDGTTTTTGIRDERYGRGGTREETKDGRGRVVKRVWKDRMGRVLEEERTSYGVGNQKTVWRTIYNPKPEGGTVRSKVIHTETDLVGDEILEETWIYNEKGQWIDGSRSEVLPNGKKKTSRWDPKEKRYVEVAATARPGFAVDSEMAGGLNTTTFTTPRGKISVNLTDDLAAGDTLSGTVTAQPEGKTEAERAQNQGELSGYVIEMEKQQTRATSQTLKWTIPAVVAVGTTALILKDKKGKEVARAPIPVLPESEEAVGEFRIPEIGQQGRPVEVLGSFDGDFSTTNLSVGGEELQKLAESPRKVVARNTSNKTGPTQLAVQEQGRTAHGEFRSLGIRLSAPKLDLLKGEQTTLTITVLGLEGIEKPVPLVLENRSSSVISMGGGNLQRISISPSQVQGDTYTTERPLTGIQRGAFTITATVTRDGRGQPQTPANVGGGGPQTAVGYPGYNICGSGCGPPATEQGTGRIRCVTTATCRGRGKDCTCHLFRRPTNTNQDYEHVEGPNDWTDRQPGYEYGCRCVN